MRLPSSRRQQFATPVLRRQWRTACRSSLLTLVAIFAGASLLAQPAELVSRDPLASPGPEGIATLLPRDGRPAGGKLVRGLASKRELDVADLSVIVTLHEPLSSGGNEARLESLHAVQHQFAARAREVGMHDLRGLWSFPIVFGRIAPGQLLDLAALPEVRAVEEDVRVTVARVEGAALMKSNTLRSQHGGTGAGVAVAVLDTGVDALHPELASRVVASGNFTDDAGDGTTDVNGHGTAAAGIVAGTNGGIAPQAGIWAIKALNDNGEGDESAILAALDAVYASRNDFGGLDVVNMSIQASGPFNDFCDGDFPSATVAINKLVGAGVTIFASSGNSGFGDGVAFPACLTATIAVGAVYDANLGPQFFEPCTDPMTAADQIPCYSNSGNPLDILAPSDCARTPAPGGGYDNCFRGTSAASPYAAGVAAQILSLTPGLSPVQLLDALFNTGRPRTDVNGITRNRVDAVAAYLATQSSGDPAPPYSTWIGSANLPGFQVQVRITAGGGSIQGKGELDCIAETICVSGALPGRPEIFVKVIGPRPNGYLWVQAPRFTPSQVEIWIRRISGGQVNYYKLDPAQAGNLSGLEDREAFLP